MTSGASTPHSLIDSCQGLVRSLALQIHRRLPAYVELDDLIGYGQIGLAEAARDFDPQRGGQFTTFAYYRIRGSIYDGLSKMSWTKRSHARRIKYDQMADDVMRLSNEDSPAAANCSTGEDASWLRRMTSALTVVYLSSRGSGDDEGDWEFEDQSTPNPVALASDRESHQRLRQAIDELPAESQGLIRGIYFDGLTLTEAGQRQGIGKAWASRLHAKTLERLARSLRTAGVGD